MHTVKSDLIQFMFRLTSVWRVDKSWNLTAFATAASRERKDEVLIVQGYNIHILIYCLDTVL